MGYNILMSNIDPGAGPLAHPEKPQPLKPLGAWPEAACLYASVMPEELKETFWRMISDPRLFSLMPEIALLKTQLSRLVEAARLQTERTGLLSTPDPDSLARIVEAIRRAIGDEAARRWTLTPKGAQEVLTQVAERVAAALEGQPPEILEKVRASLKGVRVPFGGVEGASVGREAAE
jgi:hypothetical protein